MSINIESGYSFDGSLIKLDSIKDLKRFGYDSLGLVDNTTSFWLSFYLTLKKQSINPILGFRVNGLRFDLILYPLNFTGYKEVLWYASSINNSLSVDLYNVKLSKDIAYCLDMTSYDSNDFTIPNEIIDRIKTVTDNVYMGVDFSNYLCEMTLYPLIKDKYKTIIIEKVKYLNKDDKRASEILEAIMRKEVLNDQTVFNLEKLSSLHLKTVDEYLNRYSDYKELLIATESFKKLINIEIEFERTLPKYPTRDNVPSNVFLNGLAHYGLKIRLEGTNKDYRKYKERLEYELSVINKMGFDDYFLVVYDFIHYAKRNGIYVGPGRGSGASSLVSYALRIVDIDPIEYGLYFERFLNPSRKTMPDIDTDFEDTKRDDVIGYAVNKYGETHVTLISTYQTFLAKSAIEEVYKVLEIREEKAKLIAKEIDDSNTVGALLNNPKIKKYLEVDEEIRNLIYAIERIEGVPRAKGIHAAGVIICDKDIRNYSEIHIGNNNMQQTSLDMDSIKELGLLKMDFLSLKNLSSLHEMSESIGKNYPNFKLGNVPLNDEATYRLIREKSVTGIFQIESWGMNDLAKKMRVRNFNDLAICIALYRPGPMEQIPEYLRRRNTGAGIDYYDPCLKDILKDTLGIMIYQEQTMAVVREYAGLSLAEADILRRAMSSKDSTLIMNLKDKFIEGARRLGRSPNTTERLFNDIYKFSGYGFNKAHTIAYSRLTYEFAYIKAHFPREFMVNQLKTSATLKCIKECQSMNIKVLPPDFINSSSTYEIKGNAIYMPFNAIKGIGSDYASKITSIKDPNGRNSFEEVVHRMRKESISRGVIEDLIMAGAFDYTGYNRKTMMSSLDGLLEFGSIMVNGLERRVRVVEEYDFDHLKNNENALLGFNPKFHPIKKYKGNLLRISDIEYSSRSVTIVGYVTDLRTIKTKSGDNMANLTIEDEFKGVRGVIFNRDYLNCAHYLKDNAVYEITGTYSENRGEPQFVIRKLINLNV